MNGALVMWTYDAYPDTDLLDMTPDSSHGFLDSALLIGRTFSDLVANVHITPIGKGNTKPESLDVVVNLGRFPNNKPPLLKISADAGGVALGQNVNFTAQATDPDGDPLSYFWDFDDGGFWGGVPKVVKSWSKPKDYVVRCTATDMKGGTASASVIVTVMPAQPSNTQRYRISGRVTSGGQPVQDVKITVAGESPVLTDSDGTYTLVNLLRGSYQINAFKPGLYFVMRSGPNRVTVGPNHATGIDLLAASPEKIRPLVAITATSANTSNGDLSGISGTAEDEPEGSGIERVEISLQRVSDGKYWSGTGWTTTLATLPTELSEGKWQLKTGMPDRDNLTAGDYIFAATAYDRAGNSSSSYGKEFSTALKLDGIDDYLEVKNINGLAPGNPPHTMEMWVNMLRVPRIRAWIALLGDGGTKAHHWLVKRDEQLQLGVMRGPQLQPSFPARVWTHLATTFDGKSLKAYVNGQIVNQIAADFDLRGLPFSIGYRHLGEDAFSGVVDEVRIWNVARGEGEIRQTMNTPLTGKEAGLITYWTFDKEANSVIQDRSGHGNHAKLITGSSANQENWVAPSSIRIKVAN
jgi:PKD repeat protein